jgi:hypothetical protein
LNLSANPHAKGRPHALEAIHSQTRGIDHFCLNFTEEEQHPGCAALKEKCFGYTF